MASTWKQVLTSDDVTNINLSNTNLTQNSDLTRSYLVGEANGGAKTLEIQADWANTGSNLPITQFRRTEAGEVQLYLSAFNGVWVGPHTAQDGAKYKLPPNDTCVAGKLVIGTGDSVSEFKTLDEWLDPDNSGSGFSSSSLFDATGSEPRSDKLILWDDDASKYKATSLEEVSKAIGRTYTFTYGRGASVATSGSVAMRTTNGAEGTGYVTPRDSRITGVTYAGRFFNTDGTGTVKVQLKLDGSATWTSDGNQNYQSYQFVYLENYGDETHTSVKMFGTPIEVDAGTRIDAVVAFNGDAGGDVDDQSVVVFLDYYDNHSLPLTI